MLSIVAHDFVLSCARFASVIRSRWSGSLIPLIVSHEFIAFSVAMNDIRTWLRQRVWHLFLHPFEDARYTDGHVMLFMNSWGSQVCGSLRASASPLCERVSVSVACSDRQPLLHVFATSDFLILLLCIYILLLAAWLFEFWCSNLLLFACLIVLRVFKACDL